MSLRDRIVQKFTLLLLSGKADGLRKAELQGWRGIVLLAPRQQSTDLFAREELNSSGVYLLRKEREGDKKPRVYVGQAKVLRDRIRTQKSEKEKKWWTEVVVITSSEKGGLDAHEMDFLEARMMNEIRKGKHVKVENTNPIHPRNPRDEAEKEKWENFFDTIKYILPLVRIDDFISVAPPSTAPREQEVKLRMKVPHSVEGARAIRKDTGQLLVLKGSYARGSWTTRVSNPLRYESPKRLQEELKKDGILKKIGHDLFQFTEDYLFNSSSAAAQVIAGGIRSGPQTWKIDNASGDDIADDTSHSSVHLHKQIQEFELQVPSEGGNATAYYDENTKEFVVRKGSRARKKWTSQRTKASEKHHRERLFKDGSLKIESDGICRFTRDVRFKTSSAAAGVIAGLSMSGRKYWKVPSTKQTFGDWLSTRRK